MCSLYVDLYFNLEHAIGTQKDKVYNFVNDIARSQATDWIDHTSLILQICSYQAINWIFVENFGVSLRCDQTALAASALFHTFLCHGPQASQFWLRLDRARWLPNSILTLYFSADIAGQSLQYHFKDFRLGFWSPSLAPTSASSSQSSTATHFWEMLTSPSFASSSPRSFSCISQEEEETLPPP